MEFDEFRGTTNTPKGGTSATNEGWPAAAITVLVNVRVLVRGQVGRHRWAPGDELLVKLGHGWHPTPKLAYWPAGHWTVISATLLEPIPPAVVTVHTTLMILPPWEVTALCEYVDMEAPEATGTPSKDQE